MRDAKICRRKLLFQHAVAAFALKAYNNTQINGGK